MPDPESRLCPDLGVAGDDFRPERIGPHPKLGRIHFAFSGGVFKGVAFAGVLRALFKRGVFPKSISGVSVSALQVAAFAGARTVGDLWKALGIVIRKWDQVEKGGSGTIFPSLFPSGFAPAELKRWWKGLRIWNSHGMVSNASLRWLLEDIDPRRATRQDGVHVMVGVYEHKKNRGAHRLISFRDKIFNPAEGGRREDVIEFTVASASIEPAFPPVEINGRKFADGFIIDLEPILLQEDPPDTILVFLCYPESVQGGAEEASLVSVLPGRVQRFIGFMLRHFPFADHFINHYLLMQHEFEEYLSIKSATRLAETIRLRKEVEALRCGDARPVRFPRVVVTHVPPSPALAASKYSFSPGSLTETLRAAERTTHRMLDSLLG